MPPPCMATMNWARDGSSAFSVGVDVSAVCSLSIPSLVFMDSLSISLKHDFHTSLKILHIEV